MKKGLILLLVVILLASLTACFGEKEETSAISSVVSTVSSETESSQANQESSSGEKTLRANLDALIKIQKEDDFELKITNATAQKGLYDDGSPVINLEGEDGIVVTVKNQTNITVQEMTVYILCTDETGVGVDLGSLQSFYKMQVGEDGSVIRYSEHVKVMGTTTAELEPGNSKDYAIRCDLKNIFNANAIVYSYVNAQGEEVVNPNAEKWLINTLEATVY